MKKDIEITPLDSSELSQRTKLALIELIRSSESDRPFKLPNEDKLAQMVGVSRNALRDALASLEEMGFVTRQRSKGTMANPVVARETCRLDTDPGVFRMIEGQGKTPHSQVRRLEFVEENDPVLGTASSSYLNLEILFYADDRPVVFCADHIEGSVARRGEDAIETLRERSCFNFLKEACRQPVAYSMATFDVLQADERLQELFGVGPEALFLQMDDVVYSRDLEIICHQTSYYRKGDFSVKVLRKGW